MEPTQAQIDELLASYPKRIAAKRDELDRTPRSPFEYRFAESRLQQMESAYAALWAANQRKLNVEPQLADRESFANALRAEVEAFDTEKAQVIDECERERDPSKQRTLMKKVEAIDFMRDACIRDFATVGSFSGVPEPLTRRLAARGITPLPGCTHVFEQRGGLLTLEPLIADLRQQRATAMAVLVRELELEPATAG
jgi:hypothetical protein